MFKKLVRGIIALLGAAAFPGALYGITHVLGMIIGHGVFEKFSTTVVVAIFIASGIIGGLIFFIFSNKIIAFIDSVVNKIEKQLAEIPRRTMIAGICGLIAGLLVAFLLSWLVNAIPIAWVALVINLFMYAICAILGVKIGVRSFQFADIEANIDKTIYRQKNAEKRMRRQKAPAIDYFAPKILDTSVIIDGRIFDICKTGIVEGTIVVPEFVLSELRHIADSSDSMKRIKGRRGLDILNKIQKELSIPVEVTDIDYEDMEVDAKLLRLAQEIGGKVITNDFNLNKVAAVQGVEVFNINDLSNAVKPVLIAGEELMVAIIKEGKSAGQGVAYLDDGTMIVVEDADGSVGKTVKITVTSVLQTSAGRMIFAKIKKRELMPA